MDYKILIVMGLVGIRSITFSNVSYGDPIILIYESMKAYKFYKDEINHKDNSAQNAAINSSPVIPSTEEQTARHILLKKIDECHRDNDTIILGNAFTSSTCKRLERDFFEAISAIRLQKMNECQWSNNGIILGKNFTNPACKNLENYFSKNITDESE
jgi:hypothetical protein